MRLLRHPILPAAVLAVLVAAPVGAQPAKDQAPLTSWTADNGNGTYTNPLFNEEMSDPDIIRVGDDYYLTGTTMHSMPGLPVFHSKDLVNWELLSYAFDRLEMGPEYRLENGKEVYGQGIWAPAIRHHNGTFYIFNNINGYGLQIFTATDPRGPWTHHKLGGTIYDLGVLFDDDGRIYAVHGYDEVKLIEFKPDLSGFVEGSERVIIPKGNAMGEGHHFYKVDGKYYIISANYAPVGRMQAARADTPYGPYETVTISARETMGRQVGWQTRGYGLNTGVPSPGDPVSVAWAGDKNLGVVPLHQGGIVDTPDGQWWGFSMMDVKSLGRTTFLSPVTWVDGWPYFGLPGNLSRSPVTWTKPITTADVTPAAPFVRSDDFSGPKLMPIWQWNHLPVDTKWSLTARKGHLRLNTLPADSFMWARNSLTQRAAGPVSVATATIDAKGLKAGDIAGLAIMNIPYYYVGVEKDGSAYRLRFYDLVKNETLTAPLSGPVVHLRVGVDFDPETAQFSYSTDGVTFTNIGGEVQNGYQLKTFQGVRYALFAYNEKGVAGGHADFDAYTVDEPLADRSKNIPAGKVVTIRNLGTDQLLWANPHGMLHSAGAASEQAKTTGVQFRVHDRGQGRVALEALNGTGFLTVVGQGLSADVRLTPAETPDSLFMWQDLLRNQFMLLSLKTHRYIGVYPGSGDPYGANWEGAEPDRKNGTVLIWEEARAPQ